MKSYKKLQKVTKVSKCISDLDFEHPAFRGVSGGTRASPEPVQEWASDPMKRTRDAEKVQKVRELARVTKSYKVHMLTCVRPSQDLPGTS